MPPFHYATTCPISLHCLFSHSLQRFLLGPLDLLRNLLGLGHVLATRSLLLGQLGLLRDLVGLRQLLEHFLSLLPPLPGQFGLDYWPTLRGAVLLRAFRAAPSAFWPDLGLGRLSRLGLPQLYNSIDVLEVPLVLLQSSEHLVIRVDEVRPWR